MINRQALLADLQKLLARLEADLLERSESAEVPEVGRKLRAEYERASGAERTAQNYEDWRSDAITQAAAAWVLSCVFVRFLEDNALIDPPKIAGPNDRLQLSRDEHELFFREHPRETDREYLLAVFDDVAKLPGTKDVFGEHNPIRELPNWLSGDAAGELLGFFQRIDANTGVLVHDFTDPSWDTRFLGDLYQDLSEAARKKYALLQTPEFVEEFILDRTLDPALNEFGLDAAPVKDQSGKPITEPGFRMIDPACGSGHFLLGTFQRILNRWQRHEPATNIREIVQRSLDSIYGVDVNPYAVAIARFRLLLVAMRACSITRLAEAPAFHINLACGDSLLHGPDSAVQQTIGDWAPVHHAYMPEDLPELKRILRPGCFHTVVANPPYITPKDQQLNQAYRRRYDACHRQYSLAVPFMQRLFQLAIPGDSNGRPAGYVGQITANSFMKREFGKKVIEYFLPQVDLTHVVDTSGAYIPGHGTPTVILFGRYSKPVASTIRTVMGIRGEPATPDNPARGLVWSAICNQIDRPGSQGEFVSVNDSPREQFGKHPWSIGGGGAAELKEQLDEAANGTLGEIASEVGFVIITGEDNVLLTEAHVPKRHLHFLVRPLADGEVVRDWTAQTNIVTLWPNDANGERLAQSRVESHLRYLWPYRTSLKSRKAFGVPVEQKGIPWWALREVYPSKLTTPMSIVFAFVATHNHFVLDRGGKVFKQSAPVIKLPPNATEDDHLALVGLLNSSIACFWMKQVFHNKGDSTDQHGARTTGEVEFNSYEFAGTGLKDFPLPELRPLDLGSKLDKLALQLAGLTPTAILLNARGPLNQALRDAKGEWQKTLDSMIALQEELDWQCYDIFGLLQAADLVSLQPPTIQFGERAFEFILARKVKSGEVQSSWWTRHEKTPITELPEHWSDDYKQVVEQRIRAIESNANIALVEQPEYKRRWNIEPWEAQLERALRDWLLGRLESYFDFDGRMNDAGEVTAKVEVILFSVAKLADIARQDAEFLQVGSLYRNDDAFDVERLVEELVQAESAPLLPVLRYKPSGVRKRSEWEKTWELQRREDAGEDVGTIAVPPKYTSADFISTGGARYWSLRGKLDVPKERWVSFPHCEGPDGTMVIAWAGYDHLQLARAISAYFVDIQERLGGRDDPRLVPLLAGVAELLPWIKQWRNDADPAFNGLRMGDYFESFLTEEARNLNKTIEEIKAWQPPQRATARRRRAST